MPFPPNGTRPDDDVAQPLVVIVDVDRTPDPDGIIKAAAERPVLNQAASLTQNEATLRPTNHQKTNRGLV